MAVDGITGNNVWKVAIRQTQAQGPSCRPHRQQWEVFKVATDGWLSAFIETLDFSEGLCNEPLTIIDTSWANSVTSQTPKQQLQGRFI